VGQQHRGAGPAADQFVRIEFSAATHFGVRGLTRWAVLIDAFLVEAV
jgi:hypothetical protein